MTLSSRTPEGTPRHCPVCNNMLTIEPSLPLGDAPCPHCGSLLWFLQVAGEVRWFGREVAEAVRERFMDEVAARFDWSSADQIKLQSDPRFFASPPIDSLTMVELVMELEESPE